MKGQTKRVYVSAFAIACILAVMSVAAWGLEVDPAQQQAQQIAQSQEQIARADAAPQYSAEAGSTSASSASSGASSGAAKSASSKSAASASSSSKSTSKSSSSSKKSKDAASASGASKSAASQSAPDDAESRSEAYGEESVGLDGQNPEEEESGWVEEQYVEPDGYDDGYWEADDGSQGYENVGDSYDYGSYQDEYEDYSQPDSWSQPTATSSPSNAGQATAHTTSSGGNAQGAAQQAAPSQPSNPEPADSSPTQSTRVWVEPVYEQRVVHPDTGTRYCGGVNNGTEYGTCTESWHGTKDETYNLWHDHWKAYVQRRTVEEAEQGRAYVCDHVHDDSMWVPDPDYTEEVLVQEGYWTE